MAIVNDIKRSVSEQRDRRRRRAARALYPELGSVDMAACGRRLRVCAIAFAASPVGPASWSGRSAPLVMIAGARRCRPSCLCGLSDGGAGQADCAGCPAGGGADRRRLPVPNGIVRLRRRRACHLRLGFRLRLGFLGSRCGLGCGVTGFRRHRLRRRLIALHQIRRHAGLRSRHALGKERLAVAGQLFLGVEHVRGNDFGRIELATRRARAERKQQCKRRTDANQR